jgi:hypothetical protein
MFCGHDSYNTSCNFCFVLRGSECKCFLFFRSMIRNKEKLSKSYFNIWEIHMHISSNIAVTLKEKKNSKMNKGILIILYIFNRI